MYVMYIVHTLHSLTLLYKLQDKVNDAFFGSFMLQFSLVLRKLPLVIFLFA